MMEYLSFNERKKNEKIVFHNSSSIQKHINEFKKRKPIQDNGWSNRSTPIIK